MTTAPPQRTLARRTSPWTDVTTRHFGGVGGNRVKAFERRYGPLVVLVTRDWSGQWSCRRSVLAVDDLGDVSEEQAMDAASVLAAELVEVFA